jgi:signal transduction histidine kinase
VNTTEPRAPLAPLVIASSLAIFAACVVLDILTPQELVVAILLNIPLALSGLAFSRRFTFSLVVAAILANALAGWLNARAGGGLDEVSLFNRALLAASFVLVGVLTVGLSRTSSRLGVVRLEEAQARRERDRERVLAAVNAERALQRALERAAEVLAQALGARGVILACGGTERFAEPRAAFPSDLAAWPVGSSLPAKLVGTGPNGVIQTERPSDVGLTANRALVAGVTWASRAPLLIAVLEPGEDAVGTLEDVLGPMGAAFERAELSEGMEQGRVELERRSGVIRDLVYAFSHDLRTPITANAMNMKLALEGAFGALPEAYRRTLENGITANEDLLSLADSLLLVARYESAEPRPATQTVNLAREVKSVSSRLENALRERKVRLEWRAPTDAAVRGDPSDLRRAAQNLLENAVKFSPAGETVEVKLDALEGRVRLEVADRGPGVPVDLEPRLFTRFAGGRAGGGSGLGLYLARRIAEAHGGRIGYHPRAGGGSVFWLELPLERAPSVTT